ncbi:FAD binding domain-containing protein [Prosthecomicrobium pneumaticum]|uniref:CO/xanthine dehydrogenase FAD-binding subunit n=1 Tax=Prosthecomicrobium pneumaticum TaxID=81895 RepID=A0A7W9FKM4_9HYPH|nr:FAD binding domain-containing protein [Prosthecomicrobium pneumaticum]MBB5752740.1 CO/xanthine dehydrogenase FAD-binding subunit [Prosthecomicrobium pneumaticum]
MALTVRTFPDTGAAAAALAAAGSRYLGGGTLVVRQANEGDLSFSTFVRSTDPALKAIAVEDGRVRLGAGVTMAAIAAHPALAFLAPAAKAVGGPAIRNMATVGGNLFAPSPYGDLATALLALDATVTVGGAAVPIDLFLAGRERHAAEIVEAVAFAVPAAGAFRFRKASRVKPKGAAVVTVAALVATEGGTVTAARIALGAMADRPVRAEAAEAALIGRPLTAEGIAEALAAAGDGLDPPTDAIASGWYRRAVLPVHLGRLLAG